jgi:exopolysaccharide biosynthesis polyprenyl glycosylphosphotransferase
MRSVHTDRTKVAAGQAALVSPQPVATDTSGFRRDQPRGIRRGTLVRRRLILADAIGLAIAFLVAELLFSHHSAADRLTQTQEYLFFVATIPGWIVVAKLYRLYDNDDERTDHSTVDDLTGVFHLATVGAWLAFVVIWASGAQTPGMTRLVGFWLLSIAFVTGARAFARAAARRRPEYLQNTIVVGAGEVGQLVARKLVQHKEYGIRLLGLVDSSPKPMRADLGTAGVIGTPDALPSLVRRLNVDRVVFAFSEDSPEHMLPILRQLRKENVQVDIVPRYFDVIGPHVRVHSVESLPLLALPATKRFPASEALKRALDIVGATFALILFAPVFGWIAWKVHRDSEGPVFFRQTRLGQGMHEFTVLKFRTMRTDVDQNVHRDYIKQTMSAEATPNENGLYKLDRDDAITPFGRFLRKTSLDELPQLINVLRGEMALVGPRPCLAYETEGFAPHHFERFEVPQGITGLWQVTARAHATFGEALDMDVQYARNWSLGLDLLLLLKTPIHVLRRKGTA